MPLKFVDMSLGLKEWQRFVWLCVAHFSGTISDTAYQLQELIGTVIGAESWKQSGQEDKARAVHEMRLAKEEGDRRAQYDKRSPTVLNMEGTGEKVAGIMVGCGGMKERGDEKKHAAKAKSA